MNIENSSLFLSIKEIIADSRLRVYRMANNALLQTYWQIGKLIVEDEQKGKDKAEYGTATLKKLAQQLTYEFGKGFDYTNLTNMRKFYIAFPILDTLRQELSWSHYRQLARLDNPQKINYYLHESIKSGWNSRELQRQISSLAFERVVKHLPETGNHNIQNLIKDPYIFEFLGLPTETKNSEFAIETAIIDHLQQFLLEFGKGFAFVARQQHIATDTSDFFIDLVFYNYILKCFVLIDLKIGKLRHQDLGQMQMYVNYYDRFVKLDDENKTIGIILCKDKKDTMVEITLPENNQQIFASKYELILPSKEQLKKVIETRK